MLIASRKKLSKIEPKFNKKSQVVYSFAKSNQFNDNLYPNAIYHSNYLSYLGEAWNQHLAIELTPDILWFSLLNEISIIVKSDSKKFAGIFTKTPDKKQSIIVFTNESNMPMTNLMEHLQRTVPTDTSLFVPEFSSSTQRSRLACYAAFADAVSPFYDYSVMCCGIPAIRICGTKEDYQKILSNWRTIGNLLNVHADYFAEVAEFVETIIGQFEKPDPEFLDNFFFLESCGSGSENEVFGNFSKIFRDKPKYVRKIQNYSSHIAKVYYKDLSRNRECSTYYGVFHSLVEDYYLKPCFGNVWFERNKSIETKDELPEIKLIVESSVIGNSPV